MDFINRSLVSDFGKCCIVVFVACTLSIFLGIFERSVLELLCALGHMDRL